MNGINNQDILAAVEDMKCGVCERIRMPAKPPPAAIPDSGYRQFADSVQLDIVYIRDIAGRNYPVLGVICETTLLHQATILESRLPDEVLRKFIRIWAQPFGFPLLARLDPDGAFRGEFEDYMDVTGTRTDYVPPEAHHRIGLIERHNATLRSIAEKVIDQQAVNGPEQMELAIAQTVFAKNAGTWSTGRPPFIAAFGRIPRHGGLDLLSDNHALTVGGTQHHMHQLADVLRSEAQQHLAAMRIDSSFRRALLRKTKPDPSLQINIGDTIAYWRWTTRSHKKRGGYKLARMLGYDPDGKSIWVQAGTNTVKIAKEQARQAYGFETWNPDPADLRALRQASDNIKQGIFDDESLPVQNHPHQPFEPDDQPQDVGEDLPPYQPPTPPPALQVVPHSQQPASQEHNLSQQQADPLPTQPNTNTTIQQQQQQQNTNTITQQQQQQNIHLEITSPTNIQRNIFMPGSYGLNAEQMGQPAVRTPVRRPRRSRTPNRQSLPQPRTTDIRPTTTSTDQTYPQQPPEIPLAQQHATGNSTPPLPQIPDVLEISDEEFVDVGEQVPTTPKELTRMAPAHAAGSSTVERLTPAKRSVASLEEDTLPGTQEPVPPSLGQPDPQPDQPQQSDSVQNSLMSNARFCHDSPDSCTDAQAAHRSPFVCTDNGILLNDKHFDGTTEIYMPVASTTYFQAYQAHVDYEGDGLSDDTDASQDDMSTTTTDKKQPRLTRQEQKALDKELPWRVIIERGGDYLQKFIQAAKDEEKSWITFQSVEPVDDETAKKIMSTHAGRRRVLKARAAFRDKAKNVGPVRAKCRVVMLGCLDPDLYSLNRESATPTRQSEMLIYAIFISGCNGKMGRDGAQWFLWSGDVKTAFLQGEPEPRQEPLYMAPPRDEICKLAGIFPRSLYLVRGNVYGLASAPRTWSLHVVKSLLRLGWVQHSLDKMLFMYYGKPNNNGDSKFACSLHCVRG